MHEPRFGIWTSQSKPWSETLAEWRQIERLGFDCAGIVDHFMPTSGEDDGWFHEGWTLLAALAALIPRVRLSILVTGNTYRNPVLLAKEAVTVDHISGGRLDFGIGAGWFEREHAAFGWELGSPGKRVERLDEALEVIASLLTNRRTDYARQHYTVTDAPFQPKPVQDKLPIMIGAQKPRMLGLVAKHADIWNVNHGPEAMARFGVTLNEACARIGRDPAAIRWSAFAFRAVLDREPFVSLDDFRRVTEDYLAAGATEIYYRMPETPHGRETLEVAAEILADYRLR
jgi:alkanesulfonate monooxygenase SsuD/methylene tetrahydromethanopterin reductase-like flavin-dependent oxidoreductase (luciferase family)